MKQFFAIVLALFMLAGLAACAKTGDDSTTATKETTATTLNSSAITETTVTTSTTATTETPAPTPEVKDIPALIDAVYEKYPINIGVSTDKLEAAMGADIILSMAGVKSVDKVSEIYVSGPMMAPPAYQMAIVRVKDAADAEAIAKEILENSDPGKWVCVCAEKVRVVACGDTIMMVMSSDADTKGLTDAFIELCGGKADVSLEK